MDLELLIDVYSNLLVDQVVHHTVKREYGYVTRTVITERGDVHTSLELFGCETPEVPITFWTDKTLGMPGWIAGFRPLTLVAFEHAEGLDIYPYIALRSAWSIHGKEWCGAHKREKKTMDGFEHQRVLVPRSLVLRTSQLAMTWALNTQGETNAAG